MLTRGDTHRPIIARKIQRKGNVLLGQIESTDAPVVQKSWSFTSNIKKSKVASSNSNKKGAKKQQKATNYQDKLSVKMSAKFEKAKNRRV